MEVRTEQTVITSFRTYIVQSSPQRVIITRSSDAFTNTSLRHGIVLQTCDYCAFLNFALVKTSPPGTTASFDIHKHDSHSQIIRLETSPECFLKISLLKEERDANSIVRKQVTFIEFYTKDIFRDDSVILYKAFFLSLQPADRSLHALMTLTAFERVVKYFCEHKHALKLFSQNDYSISHSDLGELAHFALNVTRTQDIPNQDDNEFYIRKCLFLHVKTLTDFARWFQFIDQ